MTEEHLSPEAQAQAPQEGPPEGYNPREDPGGPRYEDQFITEVDTPLSSPEVPLEESRKDETTVLATDQFDAEGNRIQ